MQHVDLPGTDLSVSPLCLGAPGFGSSLDPHAADSLVTLFVEAGGNFFDTAHCYSFWTDAGAGSSERGLAASLRRVGAMDGAVIGTKGGHPDGGEGYRRPDRFLAPEVIAADVQNSLQHLEISPIPLYYLHRDDSRVPVGETVEALNEQVRLGHVNWLGASNWSAARIREANAYAEAHGLRGFVISQVQWSLAVPTWEIAPTDPTMRHVTPAEAEAYADTGMPVAAYTATAGGYFATDVEGGPFDTPANAARRARARKLAAELGCTPTQVALAWLRHQRPATIPITGTTNPSHLREALGALEVALTPDQVRCLAGEE